MIKSDELIKHDIVDELVVDDKIDASNISVEVENGRVTLKGHVPDLQSRYTAELDAWDVKGVIFVVNDLTVQLSEEIQFPPDGEIKNRVRTTLKWHSLIDDRNIDIQVENGIVKLTGTVDKFWKIYEVTTECRKIAGVVLVENNLAAVPTENIEDHVIAENITNSISRKILVSNEDVDVKVEDGNVTLAGNVPSWAAWRAAYNAAEKIVGIKDIKDNIKIQNA